MFDINFVRFDSCNIDILVFFKIIVVFRSQEVIQNSRIVLLCVVIGIFVFMVIWIFNGKFVLGILVFGFLQYKINLVYYYFIY